MSEAAEAAASVTTFPVELIPLSLLDESPTNPRRQFDAAAMAELTAQIQRDGVLQPALVREQPAKGRRRWEVVLGHRRLRAAAAAGHDVLPCLVRALTDAEAFELQLAEMHQHADVHYLDEAEAYARSRDGFGHSVEEIAIQVGKSTRAVYQRLQLLHLRPEARDAAIAEGWNVSIAQLVATVTNVDEQARLLKALRKGDGSDRFGRDDDAGPTYRGVLHLLQRDFRLELQGVPWQLDDADLVPKAGPCTTCPKRTGSQPELFGEPKDRADVCTDPVCFRGKRDAVFAQQVASAEAKGQEVIAPAAAKKLFAKKDRYQRGPAHVKEGSGFVDVDAHKVIGGKYQSPREALRKKLPGVVLAQDPDGEIRQLVRKKDLNAAVRAARLATPQSAPRAKTKKRETTAAEARRDAIARFRALVAAHLRARLATAAESLVSPAGPKETFLWKLVARQALTGDLDSHALIGIAQRRGLVKPAPKPVRRLWVGYRPAEKALDQFIAGANARALRGLVLELLTAQRLFLAHPKKPYGEELTAAAEAFDCSIEDLEADLASYLTAVAGPKETAPKRGGAKKKARGKARANGKAKPAKKARARRAAPKAKASAGAEASA